MNYFFFLFSITFSKIKKSSGIEAIYFWIKKAKKTRKQVGFCSKKTFRKKFVEKNLLKWILEINDLKNKKSSTKINNEILL